MKVSLPITTSNPKDLYELLSDFINIETESCPSCSAEWIKITKSDEDIYCDCGYLLLKANIIDGVEG